MYNDYNKSAFIKRQVIPLHKHLRYNVDKDLAGKVYKNEIVPKGGVLITFQVGHKYYPTPC